MTIFEKFINTLPEELQTQDIKKWMSDAEAKQNETIQHGLILEFQDLLDHPFDSSIWKRYINSLSFLVRYQPYYLDVISNINLVQQLDIEITDVIQAPMAVSLMSIDDMLSQTPTINHKKQPILYINPVQIWHMYIFVFNGKHNDKTKKEMFDTLIFLLVHETYHILSGHLLSEMKYHYSSPKKDAAYEKALTKEPFTLEMDPDNPHEVTRINELRNIIMDASINADIINNILPNKIPKSLQQMSITPQSMTSTFQKVIDFSDDPTNHTSGFKSCYEFDISTANDFFNDNLDIKKKQYAILEMLDAQSDDNDDNNDTDNDSDGSGGSDNNSGDSNNGDGDGNGDNNNDGDGQLSESDIFGKHSDALNNSNDQDIDNVASKMNNMVNVANNEANAETNGKSNGMDVKGELLERVIQIQKAKALPQLDKKVESLINDFNQEKRLNWNRRHIAYSQRLDMAHHEKLIKAKGFYAYLDVSGSVSEELLSNLFNILYETSKNEPCYLYVFASFMSEESLEIKRNSTVNDILDFITEQELNFGTNFDPVFKHIVETMKYKHVIFSDYEFFIDEYTPYQDDVMKSPIIHVAENINYMKERVPKLYNDILHNKTYQKLIQQSDYIQKRKDN